MLGDVTSLFMDVNYKLCMEVPFAWMSDQWCVDRKSHLEVARSALYIDEPLKLWHKKREGKKEAIWRAHDSDQGDFWT